MSVDAARAGKDIWCEKPMTRTIGEGKRVMEAVKQHGNIFRLNTWFRFTDTFYGMNTTVDKIKKLVDSGMLGWPLKVTISKHTGFNWKFFWVGNENSKNRKSPAELDYDMWLGPALINPTTRTAYTKPSADTGTTTPADWAIWDSTTSTRCNTCSVRTKPARSRSRSTRRSSIPTRWVRGVKSNILYDDGCKIILYGEDNGSPSDPYIEGPNGKSIPQFPVRHSGLGNATGRISRPDAAADRFPALRQEPSEIRPERTERVRSATIVNMGGVALRLGRSLKFDPESCCSSMTMRPTG